MSRRSCGSMLSLLIGVMPSCIYSITSHTFSAFSQCIIIEHILTYMLLLYNLSLGIKVVYELCIFLFFTLIHFIFSLCIRHSHSFLRINEFLCHLLSLVIVIVCFVIHSYDDWSTVADMNTSYGYSYAEPVVPPRRKRSLSTTRTTEPVYGILSPFCINEQFIF